MLYSAFAVKLPSCVIQILSHSSIYPVYDWLCGLPYMKLVLVSHHVSEAWLRKAINWLLLNKR